MKKRLKNKQQKTLVQKMMLNSLYGKMGTGTISYDFESMYNHDYSFDFLGKLIGCKTCSSPILIGGTFFNRPINEKCPECNGTGFREMDWVEKVIHGKLDKEK